MLRDWIPVLGMLACPSTWWRATYMRDRTRSDPAWKENETILKYAEARSVFFEGMLRRGMFLDEEGLFDRVPRMKLYRELNGALLYTLRMTNDL
jgi:hypothetical protein